MNEILSQEELAERVAIVKRFRALLEKQRSRFQEYLRILEMQEDEIGGQNADALLAHSELENQIVEGIDSLQKVIVPMRKLYLDVKSSASTYSPADIVPIENSAERKKPRADKGPDGRDSRTDCHPEKSLPLQTVNLCGRGFGKLHTGRGLRNR